MSDTEAASKMLKEAANTEDRLLRNALISMAQVKYEQELRRLRDQLNQRRVA